MTIRKKIILIIGIASILAILATYLMIHISFASRYAELEKRHMRGILLRFTDNLDKEQAFLDKVSYDWANWDDTYQFVSDRNSGYIVKNLAAETFTGLQLNFMIFLDRAGRPVFGKTVNWRTGKALGNVRIMQWIAANRREWLPTGITGSQTGIALLEHDPVFVAIRPILTSQKKGPNRGTLIIGRYLTRDEIKKLTGIVSLPFTIDWYSETRKTTGTDRSLFKADDPFLVRPLNGKEILGLARLRDLSGKFSLIVAMKQPRVIYQQGQKSLFYFLFAFILGEAFLAFLLFYLVDKLLLTRLTALNQSVNEIAASNDLSVRIPVQGQDELTNFTHVFNRMMINLEQSRWELEASHQKFVDIIDLLPDPTFVIDERGHVVAWNRALEELTGIRKEEMMGRGGYAYAIPFYGKERPLLLDLVNSEESEVKRYYEYAEKKGAILFSEGYVSMPQHQDRLYLWIKAAPLYNANGEPAGAIESIRDISGRKQAEDELKYLSLYDPLTGLYNRAFFEKEIHRFNEGLSLPIGIIMCDVDGLKLVNDSLGHGAGDQLLQRAAAVIRSAFRDHDIIARIGGDEFAVLIPQSDAFILEQATHRIQDAVETYNHANGEMPLSISVGWSFRKETEDSLQDVLKEADNNMYREKLHRNESARSAIVQTLMKTLGARDFITEGHADRLKKMVVELSRELGLSDRKIHDISLLAQFHDIGKVGIPDHILFKPGPLDEEERTVMQRHTEIGYSIAQSAQELLHISEWILMHHERWDGRGYPCGRAKEEIPLECRILAIVDSYDAMTSDRPYRQALSHREAVSELRRCAGSQFDPVLVEEFITIVERETL